MTQTARKAVIVTDRETMEQFSYVPGDEIPDEHIELIDEVQRPKIFDEDEEEFRDEDGRLIVAQDNGNLAFDEGGGETPSEKDLEDLTVPELRKYAVAAQIDLGGATKKEDILARIEEVEAEREAEDGDEE